LLTLSFAIQANAQELDLSGIDIPSIPQITKPINQMTISELQAKISEIMTVIQQLQAILAQVLQQGSGVSNIPSSYSFSANLKYGTSSNEVKYLQIFLNADPDTRVSNTGWGSPGQESMYFGPKTKQSVIKFQEKYASETLTPWKLSKGTGFVGQTTRDKINQLLEQYCSGIAPGEEEEEEEPLTYCGDGIIQTPNDEGINEVCDGLKLNNQSCITKGYTEGTLKCSSTCLTFDMSQCSKKIASGGSPSSAGPVCGNNTDSICPQGCTHAQDTDCTYCGDNILQTPNDEGIYEVCDTNKLNNQTCIIKGFTGGTLQCSSNCLTFNTASCTSLTPPINHAPVLSSIGNKSTNENQAMAFTVSATDPDNNTLTYSVSNRPSGSSFNSTTRTFSWTPDYNQSGTYNVTFTVSDGTLTDTETITIAVYDINRAPVLSSIGNKSTNENQAMTFTISAVDPDNDPLTYSTQNMPSGAIFNNTTRTFTWTPTYTQSGTYNLTFIVSDSELTDTEAITITVNNVETCIPTTCLSLGYSCGTHSDGCSGTLNCGTCSTGYTCTSGICVLTPTTPVTSCTTDSDCVSRGPGFICNTSNICEWKAPIGIPVPPFGITTTHMMYADSSYTYDYGNGPEPYRIGTDGPYTHYIDPDNPNATDTNNEFGTPAKPRIHIPNRLSGNLAYGAPLPPGTVIEVHGANVAPQIGSSGTAALPIFLRGVTGDEPVFTSVTYLKANNLVIENIKWDLETYARRTIYIGYYAGAWTNIAIRGCEFYNGMYNPSSSYQVIRVVQHEDDPGLITNIVVYNNHFHNIGEGRDPAKYDAVGVSFDANTENVWIVDNYMHHIGGDGVQVAFDSYLYITEPTIPNHIYIGRNIFHDNYENAIDLKVCEDVIVSQNTGYNMGEGHTTLQVEGGNAVFRYGLGEGPDDIPRKHVWTLFNTAYNCNSPDGAFASFTGQGETYPDEIYYIGNVVYNSNSPDGDSSGFGCSDQKHIYWLNNVAYNCDRGAYFNGDRFGAEPNEQLIVVNNIFSGITATSVYPYCLMFGATQESYNRMVFKNNIFYDDGQNTQYRVGLYSNNAQTQVFTNYTTYSAFCTVYPNLCTNSIEDDPDFVNPSIYNFHLLSTSPAVDAGLSSGIMATVFDTFQARYGIDIREDIEGNSRPQGSGWDIGAYESPYTQSNQCSNTDTSCGIYPSCANCNSSDGCSGTTYRDYYCIDNSSGCGYISDDCSDCSCSCGGYNATESIANSNCNDGIDNDCDGTTDCSDTDCSADPACGVAPPPSGIPSDYIAYWKFENNALDEKGVNNGTLYGDATFINDPNKGNVVSFDGTGDYVGMGTGLQFTGPFTFSVWVNTLALTGVHTIIARGRVNSIASVEEVAFYITNTPRLFLDISNGTVNDSKYIGLPADYSTGWHLATGVWNGSALIFYWDGVFKNSQATTITSLAMSNKSTYIGADVESSEDCFKGLIDDVMIYNRALTVQEIQDIYDAQKPAGMAKAEPKGLDLKGLASILDSIKKILENLKSLF